jgi:hypothetical protein
VKLAGLALSNSIIRRKRWSGKRPMLSAKEQAHEKVGHGLRVRVRCSKLVASLANSVAAASLARAAELLGVSEGVFQNFKRRKGASGHAAHLRSPANGLGPSAMSGLERFSNSCYTLDVYRQLTGPPIQPNSMDGPGDSMPALPQ